MKGRHRALAKIKQSISEMAGVTCVDTNATTGSVLVHYDPNAFEQFQDSLAGHAEEHALFSLKAPELTEADEIADKIEAEAEFLAQHSELARSLLNLVKKLNDEVKKSTRNMVDLKVLLPLGLAVYTFTREDPMMSTPLWVTLGIFSFNSFVTLHAEQRPGLVTHEVISDRGEQVPPQLSIARQARKQS